MVSEATSAGSVAATESEAAVQHPGEPAIVSIGGVQRLARLWWRVWPWLAVVGIATFTAWPLVATSDRIFASALVADNIVTPWFYDFVARKLHSGGTTDWLTPLNFPVPVRTASEFPSSWDARFFAPLAWLVGWPRQWGFAQLVFVCVNALGTAIFARSMGARSVGLVVAGALAAWNRPIWRDLATGRMNGAGPGLALAALGLWLLSTEKGKHAPWAAAGAVVAGVVAVLVYPPYVALGVPLGLVLGMVALGRADGAGRLRAAVVVALVAMLTWSSVQDIAAVGSSRAVASCTQLGCPAVGNASTVAQLVRTIDDVGTGLKRPGALAASWFLVPMLVFARRWRSALVVGGIAALYVLLALGPCPKWDATRDLHLSTLPANMGPWIRWTSCQIQPIHDYNRLLSVGALVSAALAGLGVDRVARGSRIGWLGAVLGTGLVFQTVFGLWKAEVLHLEHWQRIPTVATATHQASLPRSRQGPMLELPFDQSEQFLSLLQFSDQPRGNPLRSSDPPTRRDRFWVWAFDLGHGKLPTDRPSAAQVRDSGIRWVYLDLGRCGSDPTGVCRSGLFSELRATLGPPAMRDGELWVWDAQNLSTTDTSP